MNVGYPGGGGEYIVQEGFGWTNGVILWIMKKFEGNLTAPSQCIKIMHGTEAKFNEKDQVLEKQNSSKSKSKRLVIIAADVLLKIGLFFRIL